MQRACSDVFRIRTIPSLKHTQEGRAFPAGQLQRGPRSLGCVGAWAWIIGCTEDLGPRDGPFLDDQLPSFWIDHLLQAEKMMDDLTARVARNEDDQNETRKEVARLIAAQTPEKTPAV